MQWTISTFMVLSVFTLAAYLWRWDSTVPILVGNASEVIMLVLAGVNFFKLWDLDRKPRRHVWGMLCAGMWIWTLGQIMDTYCNIMLGQVSYATIADYFWLLGYVILAAGLSRLRTELQINGGSLSRKENRIMTITLPFLYALLFTVLILPRLNNPQITLPARLLDFLYPTGDFLLFGFVLTTYFFARSVRDPKIAQLTILLSVGFLFSIATDILLSRTTDFHSSLYRLLGAAYLPAYLCYALAALPLLKPVETPNQRNHSDDLRDPCFRFRRLLEMSLKAHTTHNLQEALQNILKSALEVTEMKRGFIMLFSEDGLLNFGAGCDNQGNLLDSSHFQVSRSLIQKALLSEGTVAYSGLTEIPSGSAKRLGIEAGFCTPLFACRSLIGNEARHEMLGILYLDTKTRVSSLSDKGELIRYLGLHAGLALENARLHELATLDGLTHLYQRRYLDHAMEIEWKKSRRYHRPLSFLLLDLDHFKRVNDIYGHHQGDSVLRRTAQLLKNACRAGDIVARYGGEEFAVLLPDTGLGGANVVAERIQRGSSIPLSGNGMRITFSIGLAATPPCLVEDTKQLMACADAALYTAKRKGRNRLEIYS